MTKQITWNEEYRSGPLVYVDEYSAHRLWMYMGRKPQSPWSIVVTGTEVVWKQTPTFGTDTSDFETADHVLVGGKDYRFEETDPLYVLLAANGVEFRDVP